MSAKEDIESENVSKVESATERATEQVSATADSLKSATQSTGDAVTGAAQSLSEAAGFDAPSSMTARDPTEPTSNTVYVGNLFFDVQDQDLKSEFERAGPVNSVRIIKDARGLSKGFVNSSIAYDPTCSISQALKYCLWD